MSETHHTEAATAATLARLATEVKPYPVHPDNAVVLARVASDEHLRVVDLEAKLVEPLAARGNVTVYDHDSFSRLTNRLGVPGQTTVWADVDKAAITSILNDHSAQTENTPGWRDHRLTLQLRLDADWQEWTKYDGKLMDQAAFAEFIESMVHTIVNPSAADMLEVSRTFQAKRNVSFRSATRLDSGDLDLAYEVETKASTGKGSIEVPTEFEVSVPVFVNTPPVMVRARLRYRVSEGGGLGIGFALLRADLVKQAAFRLVLDEVASNVATNEVFEGTAPAALRDSR